MVAKVIPSKAGKKLCMSRTKKRITSIKKDKGMSRDRLFRRKLSELDGTVIIQWEIPERERGKRKRKCENFVEKLFISSRISRRWWLL